MLLASFKRLRLLGPAFEIFGALAVAPRGKLSLNFLPFIVGVFQQRANVIVQVVAYERRLVAMRAENDIAYGKTFDVYHLDSIALIAAQGNVPRIDCRECNITGVGFRQCANGCGWAGGGR